MITATRICEVCGRRRVTREVLDRPNPATGFRIKLWLCDACPGPDDVDARAAAIRATWSDQQHLCKHFDCSVTNLAYRLQYEFPQCLPVNHTHRVDRREMQPD